MSKKSLAAGFIIGVIVTVAAAYFVVAVLPELSSGYTKLTVVEGQGKVVTISGYKYAFTYDHNTKIFAVATEITILPSTYKATVGATYNAFGLEIKVAEANVGYCVLNVKSTVP